MTFFLNPSFEGTSFLISFSLFQKFYMYYIPSSECLHYIYYIKYLPSYYIGSMFYQDKWAWLMDSWVLTAFSVVGWNQFWKSLPIFLWFCYILMFLKDLCKAMNVLEIFYKNLLKNADEWKLECSIIIDFSPICSLKFFIYFTKQNGWASYL